eukprot:TRINITY_DN1154_c0_g1_i1.p1 TRINITY_DN1154_c0_g1~~TRINITY_DN1154_c0_g1_i1.p1  ORF type:complete len:221 (+),score=35.83 TRINITY_DN1154_c0_g1_i1:164-826(+)
MASSIPFAGPCSTHTLWLPSLSPLTPKRLNLSFKLTHTKSFLQLKIRCPVIKPKAVPRTSSSYGNRTPNDRMCLPGCDYEHWLVVMEFPEDPKPSPEEMIDTYVKTLANVVGSEEEAKRRIYAVCTTTYTGFQCLISEELSEKCKELPGVLWVLPDSYIDVPNKDYGGDKFVNGKVIPRAEPPSSERQQSRSNRRPPQYDNRRYERPRQQRSNIQGEETS